MSDSTRTIRLTIENEGKNGVAFMPGSAVSQEQPDSSAEQAVPDWRKRREQAMQEVLNRLEQGVQDLFESEKYTTYLKTMSKFHNYSLNNTLLIAMQRPDATMVAGFDAWKKKFGRHVKKGEHGIRIIAPVPYKMKKEIERTESNTGQAILGADGKPAMETVEIERRAYRVTSVFDVSQTEGKELPTLGAYELQGAVKDYSVFLKALTKACPIPIAYREVETGAKGFFDQSTNTITIRKEMSEIQTVKTLIHEMAHQKLHSREALEKTHEKKARRSMEVEAESVAYAVCQYFGIDTSGYSFGYIAGWSSGRDTEDLKKSLNIIRMATDELINDVEGYLQERQREQSSEKDRGSDCSDERETVRSGTQESVLKQLKENSRRHPTHSAPEVMKAERSVR